MRRLVLVRVAWWYPSSGATVVVFIHSTSPPATRPPLCSGRMPATRPATPYGQAGRRAAGPGAIPRWLRLVLQGDLRPIQLQQPVFTIVRHKLVNTVILGVSAGVVAIVGGVGLGVSMGPYGATKSVTD